MLVVSPQIDRKASQKGSPASSGPKKRPPMGNPLPFEVKKAGTQKEFGIRKDAPAQKDASKKSFSAGKAILVTFLLGVAGVIYLAHVFATQRIIRDMQVLQKDYERAKRLYEDRVLTYQRKTGPAEIHVKAKAVGLEFGGLNDETIVVEAD